MNLSYYKRPHTKPVNARVTHRSATVSFTSDNVLQIHIPETTDYQREAVRLLQDSGFTVFCDVSTREKLTAEKKNNNLVIGYYVPIGYIPEPLEP